MISRTGNGNIVEREDELFSLFKSQDIIESANRLCDFTSDFSTSKEWRMDCIIFCNRAANISKDKKRENFNNLDEYQKMVTKLLYDMMEHLTMVTESLNPQEAA